MSRTTQYIGLNNYALAYVKKYAISTTKYAMTTGMFGEIVEGTIYTLPSSPNSNKVNILKEVVQTEPWNSGPMIFTHLEHVKQFGDEKIFCGNYFSWMIDPSMECDYDEKTGRYYV